MPAPIALFAFNRPEHLQRTLASLSANELAAASDLTIFCDGPRTDEESALTDAVREIASQVNGFASISVVPRDKNLGCADSVIAGLHAMFAMHERVVVIEDDVVSSPYMLRYLNTGLEKYAQNKVVFNVSAWSYPSAWVPIPNDYPFDTYFLPRFTCNGGWASWRDRWEEIHWDVPDYEEFMMNHTLRNAFGQAGRDTVELLEAQRKGRIDSWAIRMDYARFKQGCLGLNPVLSYTANIGVGSGTHTLSATTRFDNNTALALREPTFPKHIFVDPRIPALYCRVTEQRPMLLRAINKAWRMTTGKNLLKV